MNENNDNNFITERLLDQEWLVTNGLGGYAAGTASGVLTRRYHSYLVAALPNPHGRMVMLNSITETIGSSGCEDVCLTGEERAGCSLQLHGAGFLTNFGLEMGLPVWRYEVSDARLEKRLFLRHRQNTVQISYRLDNDSSPLVLKLAPAVHFRPHNDTNVPLPAESYSFKVTNNKYEIEENPWLPALKILAVGHEVKFTIEKKILENVMHRVERERGYDGQDNLWVPGFFSVKLGPGEQIILVCSTETWDTIESMAPLEAWDAEVERRRFICQRSPPALRTGIGSDLLLSADQFLFRPVSRWRDITRIYAAGDAPRSVIAGFHWFADWGRDAMISLEGLTLTSGHYGVAGWILRTFARYIKDGLIPNLFPEQHEEGRYNTADATLWMFHALKRYLDLTKDWATIRMVLPKLQEIVARHISGTRFNIGIDPSDRLLRQGEKGYALTWMDAKVDDWVVTPRRGKAVEINALWYNALIILADWLREEGISGAVMLAKEAEQVKQSFNRRFWHEKGGYLYDIIDGENGDDPACRPNQLFAISLLHPVLEEERWAPVLQVVRDKLVTPYGLRTLSQDHPDYQNAYTGDVTSRDKAYHNGTVWPWLVGPYIDARLKVNPRDKAALARSLEPLLKHFKEQACLGTISEVFDPEPPYMPKGCVAQAWSVAEVLRAWMKTRE